MKGKFWKIVAICLAVMVVGVTLGGVGFVAKVKSSEGYVQFDTDKLNKVYSSLTILDTDGNTLQEAMYYKNIKQIPLSALNEYTYMAFVSVEDKRFFEHDGIDFKRVVGATLSNLKSKSIKEGASTITQQLIKNTHLDNAKTLKRKINEMLLARQMEREFSKQEILEMYLNTIYFGRNAYGIENASNVYFDKSARNLTVAESAILAGMIKAPNVYAPDKNLAKCKQRRDVVLGLMKEQQVITQEQYDQALQSNVTYTPQKKVAEKTYVYHVLQEACKILNMTECQLLNSNYTIKTYCNQQTQQELCKIARADCTLDKNGNLANLSCVVANDGGKIQAYYSRGENADSKRQVGSALKPIAVYAPALNEKIITQASLILDEKTNFNGYVPTNVGGYNGWVTVKDAVARSLNVPAVKTLNSLTLPTAQKYLEKLGFTGEQNLSLALGNIQGGLTPLELAHCYTALANNGLATQTNFIESIENEKGVIYQNNQAPTRVFDQSATFLMTDLLCNAVQKGTGKNLSNVGYQLAGKTGTVGNKEGNSDAIFCGYTTQNTLVVWFSGELDNATSGSTAPCLFARKVLAEIYKDQTPTNFTPPRCVQNILLDEESLHQKQQQKIAERGESFWFDTANKPTEKLDMPTYDYTLRWEIQNDYLVFSLPTVEGGTWELWKELDGKLQKLSIENNCCQCYYEEKCSYFAKLLINGKTVYTTPSIQPCKPMDTPNEKEQEQPFNFLDFWYWK